MPIASAAISMLSRSSTARFFKATHRWAYYVMTDISASAKNDVEALAHRVVRENRARQVPGSSFYLEPERGRPTDSVSFRNKNGHPAPGGERLKRLERAG